MGDALVMNFYGLRRSEGCVTFVSMELVNTLLKIVKAAFKESPRTQTNNLHQQISAPSSETSKLRSESAEGANVMLRKKVNRPHHLL